MYCSSLDTCSYLLGAIQTSDNRLFGVYHANTPQQNKAVILNSLTDPCEIVRIAFATVALGMGVAKSERTKLCDTLSRPKEYRRLLSRK